ncbi:MAG: nitroreductase family protein [Tissierellaceae bacterium]|nr:nitroreductase family protein [Tissierellaceae bacterium]
MDIIEGIMTRRSIRHFTGELISDEQLDTMLRAGFQAPSAHNCQPWEFIVVRDKDKIKEIKEYHKYAKMLGDAGTAIVVCGDINRQDNMGFLVADTSAAIQNMLLAAHGLGLGAVWCGIYDIPQLIANIKETLNLPENVIPIGMVVVGNKIKDRTPQDRYDENKIHYDTW